MDSFRLAFLRKFHLPTSGPFGMVFEHFQIFFDLGDSLSNFIEFH
jgi:hypothetical protein